MYTVTIRQSGTEHETDRPIFAVETTDHTGHVCDTLSWFSLDKARRYAGVMSARYLECPIVDEVPVYVERTHEQDVPFDAAMYGTESEIDLDREWLDAGYRYKLCVYWPTGEITECPYVLRVAAIRAADILFVDGTRWFAKFHKIVADTMRADRTEVWNLTSGVRVYHRGPIVGSDI